MIVVIGSPFVVPGSAAAPSAAGGLAAGVALSAAAAGGTVQLVGRVGEDPAGESTLLALARSGVGHVATRRDPAHPTRALAPGAPDAADGGPDDPIEVEAFADGVDDTDESAEAGGGAGSGGAVLPDGEGGTSLGPPGSATLDREDLELALRYLDTFSVVVVAEPLERAALAVVADAAAYAGAALIVLVGPAGDEPALPPEATLIEAPVSDPDGVFARTVGAFAAALDGGAEPGAALASVVAAGGWQRPDG